MEEKCLNEFLRLFGRFNSVAFFVANKIVNDGSPNPLTGIEDIIDDLIRCGQLYENHEDWNILNTALNEIKQNLWSLSPDNRVIYLKSIIRKFVDLSLYTNNNYILCIEDIKTGACSKKDSNKRYLCLLQIQEFLKDALPFHKQTPAQQYIFLSAETLYRFECELGRICEDFDINFMKLQEDLGIYLRKWKEYEENYSYVYIKLSHQAPSTETSSALTIGELTVEQTENLFKLVNGVVFEKTSIEIFVESLNNPDNNTLRICTRGKAKAIILFHELDSVYGGKNIISKRQMILGSFNPPFDKYYAAHSGDSEYARLSPGFKTNLNTIFK